MTSHAIADKLCRDLVRRVGERDGRHFIVTPFKYGDGDLVNVYIVDAGGAVFFSDLGATIYRLEQAGVGITEGRDELVNRITALHGVSRLGDVLNKQLNDAPNVGASFISLCAAITRISNLELIDARRKHSALPATVDGVLRRLVEPVRGITRDWVNADIDPDFAFPVDFHANTRGEGRNVFTVTSREKGVHVSAVCNFLKANNRYDPTLAVIDVEGGVTGRPLRQLQSAVDEICFGASGEEETRIAAFALGEPLNFALRSERP